jgi:hypothetical protein
MAQAVFCTVGEVRVASQIVRDLKAAGFANHDISVVMPEEQSSQSFAIENETKAPEGAAVGAGTGALLGGGLGWLAGIGSLAIPGVGPLIAAGPIMAALSGAALGGTLGGVTGALIGLGIPEYEARRYEDRLKGGNAVIAVHCTNLDDGERARQIFEAAGAEDIHTSNEVSSVDVRS